MSEVKTNIKVTIYESELKKELQRLMKAIQEMKETSGLADKDVQLRVDLDHFSDGEEAETRVIVTIEDEDEYQVISELI